MIDAEIVGDDQIVIKGINEIHKVTPGDLMFVDVEKYFAKALQSAATGIILNEKIECPKGKVLLVVDEPFEAYNFLAKKFRPAQVIRQPIHPGAKIHPSTTLETGVIIADNVSIGENCFIEAGAIIRDHVVIGNNVIVQSGAIIGSDAFYYKKEGKRYKKWHTCGRVIIEDNTVIGAGCTVNKGVSGDTIIGEGSKLDCLVHIGHGAVVGKNCLLAGQVGIGGKTIIGDNAVLYGQVGIAQNLIIGENVIVLAKSGVSKNLASGKTYFGSPAEEVKLKYRELAMLRSLSREKRKK